MKTNPNDERVLVFLRAPGSSGTASLRYQWRCNQIELPGAAGHCVVVESTAVAHARSEYMVVINDGARYDLQPPAVVVSMRTLSSPPWRWPDLAAELRGQPDLFATLATAFRALCVECSIQVHTEQATEPGLFESIGRCHSGPIA